MMILIADSGSTKTDWALLYQPYPSAKCELLHSFQTQGITPVHQTGAQIRQVLEQEMVPQLSKFSRARLADTQLLEGSLLTKIHVFFYGSGCTPDHVPMMVQMLSELFSPQNVDVQSDLMAAARALCQHEAGIGCILGTGANSCLFDGKQIVQNTPALGYILGDEGSGSVLGRMFMNAIFKNPDYADIRDAYLHDQRLTQADIIRKVYSEPMGNRFLASTSLYIEQHLDHPLLRQLVIDNFRAFFRANLNPYRRKDLPVGVVGSMAFHYREQLEEAARLEGYTLGNILKSPMEGLITYHS